MSDNDVISLATGKPIDADPKPDVDRSFSCAHTGWTVNRHTRTLKCRECAQDVDPFEALSRVAREYERLQEVRQERRKLEESLARLATEERKTKARLKNASRKDADTAVAAERAKWEDRLRNAHCKAREVEDLARSIQRLIGTKPRGRA